MQDHLKQLLLLKDPSLDIEALGKNNNPESIETSYDKTSKQLTITYKMANQGKNMQCHNGSALDNGARVCCKRGDNECRFTQKSITLEKGTTRIVLTPENTPKLTSYDYCLSGYCYLTIDLSRYTEDICGGRAKFEVQLDVSDAKSAIKRYESKDSPTDHQSYFVLDYSHNYGDNDNNGAYNTQVVCDGCKNNATVKTGYIITDEAVAEGNFASKEEACLRNNTSAIYDAETDICYVSVANSEGLTNIVYGKQCINCVVDEAGKCITTSGNKPIMVEEQINSRRISDPTLNCIVNMSYTEDNMGRGYYDYSDKFGVNTEVCRIYCSDETNVFLANKKDVYVGMHLKYDIESMVEKAYGTTPKTNRKAIFDANNNSQFKNHGGANDTSEGLMLSAIVMQERKCVSKIYYDHNTYESSIDWMTKYKLDGSASGSIVNWKTLYSALRTKAGSENERREILNQLVYDLYNCNLMNSDEIYTASNNGKIGKPVDRDNVYEKMIEEYKTKGTEGSDVVTKTNVHLQDHRCGDGNSTCAELISASYEGGAQYIPTREAGTNSRVGVATGEPEITYYTTSNTDMPGNKPITIMYCDWDKCFKGKGTSSDRRNKNDYIEDYAEAKPNLENATMATLDSQTGDNRWSGVKIPTKEYAIFTIQLRTDFYNSDVYQTEYYTGRVQRLVDTEMDTYVKLDKFIYPVSLDAFQDKYCYRDKDYEIGGKEHGRCQTVFAFNISPIEGRKNSMDKYTQYLKTRDITTYTCNYVSRSEPIREGIVYRNIGLDDPFPNIEARPKATNWMTDYGRAAINEITHSSEDIYKTSREYLEYSYTFTKQALEEIRDEYNYQKDIDGVGYAGVETIKDCLKANPETYRYRSDFQSEENGTIYVQCKSTFIEKLNHNEINGATMNKGNGVSDYTMNVRDRN